MKIVRLTALCIALALPALGAVSAQSTPPRVRVQGFLSDSSGGASVPGNGTFTMSFDLYDAESGGLLLQSSGPMPTEVIDGFYSVELTFTPAHFDGTERWIEITVEGEILSPRVRVASMPFAFVADTLDGLDAAALDQSAAVAGLQGQLDAQSLAVSGLQSQLDGHVAAPDPHPVYVSASGDTMTGNLTLAGGSLGVGAAPDRPLAVTGSGAQGQWLSLKDNTGFTRWHLNNTNGGLNFAETLVADGRLFLGPGGNVGIGTLFPADLLQLGDFGRASDGYLQIRAAGGPGAEFRTGIKFRSFSGIYGFTVEHDDTLKGLNFVRHEADGTGASAMFINRASGNVGIGTLSPDRPLTIRGVGVNSDLMSFKDNAGVTQWHVSKFPGGLNFAETGVADGRLFLKDGGNVGIGTVSPNSELHVQGALHLAGTSRDISWPVGEALQFGTWDGTTFTEFARIQSTGRLRVREIQITGGADIVESFETAGGEALLPGTVVVIDPETPGALTASRQPYDPKVAGIVSGAGGVQPGLSLGQDGVFEGDTQVAMTGRVYARCSTENGAIRPGDRLTTASLPGHAMKATDAALSDGAVLGKAMTSLDEAEGLVLVLVNLQ